MERIRRSRRYLRKRMNVCTHLDELRFCKKPCGNQRLPMRRKFARIVGVEVRDDLIEIVEALHIAAPFARRQSGKNVAARGSAGAAIAIEVSAEIAGAA